MTSKLVKYVELAANVAILIVSILLGAVLIRHQLFTGTQTQIASTQPRIAAGTKLLIAGVNWSENRRTMLLALSTRCHFCTESAEFYRRLAEVRAHRNDIRLVAVLPQEVGEGQAYLNRLGVKVDEVKQSPLDSVGVTGTPTLILVDGNGVVANLWVGALTPDKENEVVGRLSLERASK